MDLSLTNPNQTIKQIKAEFEDGGFIEGWCGAVQVEIEIWPIVHPHNDVMIIPSLRPSWRRYATWQELADYLNNHPKEIQFHNIGRRK